ncbi:hypothetical protein B0H13DRAFT_1888724 [Mycena leptocephala]|nr:hypothetical protein B0H13DRAFT_1888724 [Mycena leptocephala]
MSAQARKRNAQVQSSPDKSRSPKESVKSIGKQLWVRSESGGETFLQKSGEIEHDSRSKTKPLGNQEVAEKGTGIFPTRPAVNLLTTPAQYRYARLKRILKHFELRTETACETIKWFESGEGDSCACPGALMPRRRNGRQSFGHGVCGFPNTRSMWYQCWQLNNVRRIRKNDVGTHHLLSNPWYRSFFGMVVDYTRWSVVLNGTVVAISVTRNSLRRQWSGCGCGSSLAYVL